MTEFAADTWRLSGPVTAREVPGLYAESRRRFARDGLPARVDLGAVEATDSSALALLMEWLSWARREKAAIAFDDPPHSLRVIAELSDSEGLMGWPELKGEAKPE